MLGVSAPDINKRHPWKINQQCCIFFEYDRSICLPHSCNVNVEVIQTLRITQKYSINTAAAVLCCCQQYCTIKFLLQLSYFLIFPCPWKIIRLDSERAGHASAPVRCGSSCIDGGIFFAGDMEAKSDRPETIKKTSRRQVCKYLCGSILKKKHRPVGGRHQYSTQTNMPRTTPSPLNSSSEIKPSFSQVLIAVTNCVMMVSTILRSSKPTCSPCNECNQSR